MIDNQSVVDRLKLFIKSKNIGQTKFEEICNLGRGWVSKIKGTPKDDKLLNILQQFPDLNRTWLLTGEGTMLRTDATSESSEEAEMEATDLVRELRRQLEEERRKNEELQKKTDAQQSTINSMAKTMEMMMEEKQKIICG